MVNMMDDFLKLDPNYSMLLPELHLLAMNFYNLGASEVSSNG
jgi:hypothetical protein